MAFKARSMEQIRDSMIANLQARYQSETGDTVNVKPGSHHYMLAECYALELALIEAAAEAQTQQILPDKADSDVLTRHGDVEGLTLKPATAAVLTFSISGTPSTSSLVGSSVLVATSGLTFAPATGSSATTSGAGTGTITATCQTLGAAGTLSVGTVVQWSSAPTGINPTATVTSVTTAGVDEESPDAFAARIIAHIQARPASFNRAEVAEIVGAYAGVVQAFVYPLLEPVTLHTGVPGAFTALALGPIALDAQGNRNGDSPTNTRFIGTPGASVSGVVDYIEGTRTAAGVAITDGSGTQLRPIALPAGSYAVETPGRIQQNVSLSVIVTAANAATWGGGSPAIVSSTTTTVVVSGDWSSTGAVNLVNKMLRLYIGRTYVRGGYQAAAPISAVYNSGSGNTTLTFSTPFAHAPDITVSPAPAPLNYDAIRKAVFAYFDTLTPGDAAAPSTRWPLVDATNPASLSLSQLLAAVLKASGVTDVTVSFPIASVTPSAKTLIDLGDLAIDSN